MGHNPLHDEAIAYAAQNTEYTYDEVVEIVETIQTVMGPKLAKLYYDAWLRNKQNFLMSLEGEIVAFAFPETEWGNHLRDVLSVDEIQIGMSAHQYYARNHWDFVVQVNQTKLADHYPLFVLREGDAEMGEEIAGYHFARMMKLGMSPAEAVDYWLCERQDWDAGKVARWRGISREAVNKNVRQAKDVFGDFMDAVDYHDEKNIEAVRLNELDQPKEDVLFEDPEP
jgi:hypothetical protein